ncbi:MAG: right-handed parallel beta-helix repeat-containing protein, partial [Coraliomargarita sp.]
TKPIKIVREPGNDPDEFTVYVEEYGHTQSALASYKPGHVAITKQFFVDYEKEFAAQYQPFPNGLKKHFDGGFHFSFVRNFTLENVVLMGMPGLGFKGRIDDSLFKNVTVRPFHERGQIISVTRGGFIIDQMFNSRVEDCHFEGTMDDLSALRHIPCYLTGIDQTKGKQRILLQPRTSPNRPFNFDVGDQIVTFDVNTATKSRPYRIMKVEIDKAASIKTSRDLISRPDIDYTSAWVTLDRPITEDLVVKTGDAKTYNRFYIKIDQPNVITNTVFSNCFRSGSLVSSGHIYSNCKFYHTAYGLHISDRDHGLEDFHVVDCLFYGQRLPSINIGKAPGANASRFKTNNVKILRNTFYVTKAKQSAMKISHVSDIEIRDNQIYINETELKKYLPGIIKSSGEVIFENNIVRKGPLAHVDDFNASSLEQYQDWEQVADYFEISAR